jgi:hypothetical protein
MLDDSPSPPASAPRLAESTSAAALRSAREAFAEHCDANYVGGAEAALRDCDRLEALADQLATAMERLRPAVESLDVARDVALYRGPVLSRMRSRFDPQRLALLAAEALGEALLSAPAGAVLAAAARREEG